MGTISEKLTYLNTTKQNIKQAINNLGGDITNETTFRNYATELNTIYSKLPKVSDTGTNVSLNPTLKGRLGIVPKGNTYQESTTGKNLLDTTITTQTLNGIQITKNSDGSITLNGTTTATFNIEWKTNNITLPAGTYYIGLGTTTNSFNLYFNKSGGGFEVLGNPASSSYYTLTLNEETTYTGLKSYVGSGITFNNVTFYPMITKTLPFTYEKYTNGASPNPDYPQEIQSATGTQKVVVSGKNLLGTINEADYTSHNVTTKANNGVLNVSGASDTSWANLTKTIYFDNELPIGTYTFSIGEAINYGLVLRLVGTNVDGYQILKNNSSVTFTTTEVKDRFYLFIQNLTAGENIDLEIKPKLEEGTTIKKQEANIALGNIELNKIGDYEDYIGGTPDNWVLYKNIGKVVFDGSSDENWSTYSNSGVTNRRFITTIGDIIEQNSSDVICNRFQKGLSNVNDNFIQTFASKYVWLGSTQIENLDLAQFKTWLSANNVEVLYVLAETQQIPITEEPLVSQLNELYYLQSYNDTTNIDVTGNLPMRITASAIKGA